MNAETLCLLAAGLFFMTGLLTGLWKYAHIARSASATAPVYVDIAHRSSLMYAFAAYLMHGFVPYSPVSPAATVWVVGAPLLFFALAISTYVLHGLLRDTDNQLRSPHQLGSGTVSGVLVHGFMWALAVGEIGGFAILFWGFLRAL
jgi:hypothetical protein